MGWSPLSSPATGMSSSNAAVALSMLISEDGEKNSAILSRLVSAAEISAVIAMTPARDDLVKCGTAHLLSRRGPLRYSSIQFPFGLRGIRRKSATRVRHRLILAAGSAPAPQARLLSSFSAPSAEGTARRPRWREMRDLLNLIRWMLLGMFRSKTSLEAEILALHCRSIKRAASKMPHCTGVSRIGEVGCFASIRTSSAPPCLSGVTRY